jgi:hypothetical protein
MLAKEGADGRSGHVLAGDLLGGEPDAEVFDGEDVSSDRAPGVAAGVEVGHVVRDPGAQRVGPDAVTDTGSNEEVVDHGCPPFGTRDRPGASRIMQTTSKSE